jgi:hypothetical protein
VFTVNAVGDISRFKEYIELTRHQGVALLGFIVLQFCRFPPNSSRRLAEEHTPEPVSA